jgi:hypothetical protein
MMMGAELPSGPHNCPEHDKLTAGRDELKDGPR